MDLPYLSLLSLPSQERKKYSIMTPFFGCHFLHHYYHLYVFSASETTNVLSIRNPSTMVWTRYWGYLVIKSFHYLLKKYFSTSTMGDQLFIPSYLFLFLYILPIIIFFSIILVFSFSFFLSHSFPFFFVSLLFPFLIVLCFLWPLFSGLFFNGGQPNFSYFMFLSPSSKCLPFSYVSLLTPSLCYFSFLFIHAVFTFFIVAE